MRWTVGIVGGLLVVVAVNIVFVVKAVQLQHNDPVVRSYLEEGR